MKWFLVLLPVFFAQFSFASISCNSATSSLTFSSDEGVAGNLVSITVNSDTFDNPHVFAQDLAEGLAVERNVGETKQETLYMASSSGYMVTLILWRPVPEGQKSPATIYFSGESPAILKENLVCGNESTEGRILQPQGTY